MLHLLRPALIMLISRMGYDADDEIARRFTRSQSRSADGFGNLHLVTHMLFLLLALSLGSIGGVGLVRVLHPIRIKLAATFWLDLRGTAQNFDGELSLAFGDWSRRVSRVGNRRVQGRWRLRTRHRLRRFFSRVLRHPR